MATLKHYISIARPDHWTKHIFIVPGIVAAFLLIDGEQEFGFWNILIGFASACLIASANYVINEWLDADFDRHHPVKKDRPAVTQQLAAHLVYIEYILLALLGLGLAWSVNFIFWLTSLAFLLSGLIYNVKPIRLKERVYLDVITESINNPIRLTLGWTMISSSTIPPLSLITIFWFGGAFLMAVKRLGEYRFIVKKAGVEVAGKYRASFKRYTEENLIASSFSYSFLSSFSIAIFLVKYREEFVLLVPILTMLFGYYLKIGLSEWSVTQNPEKLHHDRKLMAIVIALLIALAILSFVDIEVISTIVQSKFTYVDYSQ